MPTITSDGSFRTTSFDAQTNDDDPAPITFGPASTTRTRPSGERAAATATSGDTARASHATPHLATPSRYGTLVAAVDATKLGRDEAVRAKLDEVRTRFSGPYVVMGEVVSARPMFRMNHARPAETTRVVWEAARRSGVGNANPVIWGQGSPGELVKVTQALIDMGRLPPPPGDVASRVRKMQWDHGIGVDCAGYCKEALLATSPRVLPLRAPGMESFRDVDVVRARHFARTRIGDARPGDLITLDPLPPERYGHNVVVYSRTSLNDSERDRLATLHGAAMRSLLASPGPHHLFEVDSSWGAGAEGAEHGGYRRDTWLYDASTKTWGSFTPAEPRVFVTSTRGPSGDAFHGVYRPGGS